MFASEFISFKSRRSGHNIYNFLSKILNISSIKIELVRRIVRS